MDRGEPIRMLMEFVDEKTIRNSRCLMQSMPAPTNCTTYIMKKSGKDRSVLRAKRRCGISLLQIIARFRARQMAPPPFQVFHFMDYKMTYPVIKAYAEFHLHEEQ